MVKWYRIFRNVVIVCLLSGMITSCFLGDQAGEISGKVTDTSGNGLQYVTITTSPATSTVKTNWDGTYKIENINKTQEYIITTLMIGYKSESLSVILEVGSFSCAKPTRNDVNFMLAEVVTSVSTKTYEGNPTSNPYKVSVPEITDLSKQIVLCYVYYRTDEWLQLPHTSYIAGDIFEDVPLIGIGYVQFETYRNYAYYSGKALYGATYKIVVKTFSSSSALAEYLKTNNKTNKF